MVCCSYGSFLLAFWSRPHLGSLVCNKTENVLTWLKDQIRNIASSEILRCECFAGSLWLVWLYVTRRVGEDVGFCFVEDIPRVSGFVLLVGFDGGYI